MIWNSEFMNKIRTYWLSQIYKLQAKTGEERYIDLETVEKSIDGDAISVLVKVPSGDDFTIYGIRIIDVSGSVAGEILDGISKTSDDEFYIILRFPIYET